MQTKARVQLEQRGKPSKDRRKSLVSGGEVEERRRSTDWLAVLGKLVPTLGASVQIGMFTHQTP